MFPIRIFLVLLLFINGVVCSAEIDKLTLSAGLSWENSDNVRHTAINALNENITHYLISTEYNRESGRINAQFSLLADRQIFENHSYSDQTVVSSMFTLNALLSKQKLYWDVKNRLDRVQINQQVTDVPSNQQNTDYFATGPRYIVFKNKKDSLDLGLSYERFYTEKTNNDLQGYIVDSTYNRNITRTTAMGVVVRYNDRTFDDQAVNTNYTRSDVTLNLTKRLKLSSIELDIGGTNYVPENQAAIHQGIFRAKYEHQLGKKTQLKINYSRELSDYTNEFTSAGSGATTNTSVSGKVFVSKQGRISITKKYSMSDFNFDYTYKNDDYGDSQLDIITRLASLSVDNRLTTSLSLNMGGGYSTTRYPGVNRLDLTRTYTIGLSDSFANAYNLSINIQYTNNGSTDGNYIYQERRIYASGHYYF